MSSVRALVRFACLWPLLKFFRFQKFHQISKIPKTKIGLDYFDQLRFFTKNKSDFKIYPTCTIFKPKCVLGDSKPASYPSRYVFI